MIWVKNSLKETKPSPKAMQCFGIARKLEGFLCSQMGFDCAHKSQRKCHLLGLWERGSLMPLIKLQMLQNKMQSCALKKKFLN